MNKPVKGGNDEIVDQTVGPGHVWSLPDGTLTWHISQKILCKLYTAGLVIT